MKYWLTEVLIGDGVLTFTLWFLMFSLSNWSRVKRSSTARWTLHLAGQMTSISWLCLVLYSADLWSRSQGLWGLYVGSASLITLWRVILHRLTVRYMIKRELSQSPNSAEVRRWAISDEVEGDNEPHDPLISELNRLRLIDRVAKWQRVIYGETGLSKIALSCADEETDRRAEVLRVALRSAQDISVIEQSASSLALAYRLEVALALHVHSAHMSVGDPELTAQYADTEPFLNRALVLFDYLGSAWLEHHERIEPALETFDEALSIVREHLIPGEELGYTPHELVQYLKQKVDQHAFKQITKSSLIFYELILSLRLIDQRYFRVGCARLDQCFSVWLQSSEQTSRLRVDQELMEGVLKSFVANATRAAQDQLPPGELRSARALEAERFGVEGAHYLYADSGRSPNRAGALHPPERPLERGLGFGSLLVGVIGFSALGVTLYTSPRSDDVQVLYDVPSSQPRLYPKTSERQITYYSPRSSLFIADQKRGVHRVSTETFYLDEERGAPPLGPGGQVNALSTDQERVGALVRPSSAEPHMSGGNPALTPHRYEIAWRDIAGGWKKTFSLSDVTDADGEDVVALLHGWGPVTMLLRRDQSYALLAYHEEERLLYTPKISGDPLRGEFISSAPLKVSADGWLRISDAHGSQRAHHAFALKSDIEGAKETSLVIAEVHYDGQRLDEVTFYELGQTMGGCDVRSMAPRGSGDTLDLQFVCASGAAWVWSLSNDLSVPRDERVRDKQQVRGGSQLLSHPKPEAALVTPQGWLWASVGDQWIARSLNLPPRAPGEGVGWSVSDRDRAHIFDQRAVSVELGGGELLTSSPKHNTLTQLSAQGRKINRSSLLRDGQELIDSTRVQSGLLTLSKDGDQRIMSHLTPQRGAHGVSEREVYRSLTLDQTPHRDLIHRDEAYHAIAALDESSRSDVIALTESGLIFRFESLTDHLRPLTELGGKVISALTSSPLADRADSIFSRDGRELLTLTKRGEVQRLEVKREATHQPLVMAGEQPTAEELNESVGVLTTSHQITLLSLGVALQFDLNEQARGWTRIPFRADRDSAPLLVSPTPLVPTPHAWALSDHGEATLLQASQAPLLSWSLFKDKAHRLREALRGAGVEFFGQTEGGWFGFLFEPHSGTQLQLKSVPLLSRVSQQPTTGPLSVRESNLRRGFIDYLSHDHLYSLNRADRSWSRSSLTVSHGAELSSCEGAPGSIFSSKQPSFLAALSPGSAPLLLNAESPAEQFSSHGSPPLRHATISPAGVFGLSEGNSITVINPEGRDFKLRGRSSTLDSELEMTSIAEVVESDDVFWVRAQDGKLAIYSPREMKTTRVSGDVYYTALHPSGQGVFASSRAEVSLFSKGEALPKYTWSASRSTPRVEVKRAGVAHDLALPLEASDGSLHILEVSSGELQRRELLRSASPHLLSDVTASVTQGERLYVYGREGGYVRGADPLTPFERLPHVNFEPEDVALHRGDIWLKHASDWVRQRDGLSLKGGFGSLNDSTLISARDGSVALAESGEQLSLFGSAPSTLIAPRGMLPLSSGEIWIWSERGSALFNPKTRSYRAAEGHLPLSAPLSVYRDARSPDREWVISQSERVYGLNAQGKLSALFGGSGVKDLTIIGDKLYGLAQGRLIDDRGDLIPHQPLQGDAVKVKITSAISHSDHLIRLYSTGEIDAVNFKTLRALSLQPRPNEPQDAPAEFLGVGGGSDPSLIYLKKDGSISALKLSALSGKPIEARARSLTPAQSDSSFVGRDAVITLSRARDQVSILSFSDLSVSYIDIRGSPWPCDHLEPISGSPNLLARVKGEAQEDALAHWRLYNPLSAEEVGEEMSGELLLSNSEGVYIVKRAPSEVYANSLSELKQYDPRTGKLLRELKPRSPGELLLYHLHEQPGRDQGVTIFRLYQSKHMMSLTQFSDDLTSEVTLVERKSFISEDDMGRAAQVTLTDHSRLILLPKIYLKISRGQPVVVRPHNLKISRGQPVVVRPHNLGQAVLSADVEATPRFEAIRNGDIITIKEIKEIKEEDQSTSLTLKLVPEEYEPNQGFFSKFLFWMAPPKEQRYEVSSAPDKVTTEHGTLDLRSGWYLEETVTGVSFRGDEITLKPTRGEASSIHINVPRSKKAEYLFSADQAGALSVKISGQEVSLGVPSRGQLPLNRRFRQVALTSTGAPMIADEAGQLWAIDQARDSAKLSLMPIALPLPHSKFYVARGALLSKAQGDERLFSIAHRAEFERDTPHEELFPDFRVRSGDIGAISWREHERAVAITWRPSGVSPIPASHTLSGYDIFHSDVIGLTSQGLRVGVSGQELIVPIRGLELKWADARRYDPSADRPKALLTERPRGVTLSGGLSLVETSSSPPQLEMVIERARFPFSAEHRKFTCDHITSATAQGDRLITVSSGQSLFSWRLNSDHAITEIEALPPPVDASRYSSQLTLSSSGADGAPTLSLGQRRWELKQKRWQASKLELHLHVRDSRWERVDDRTFALDQERFTLLSGRAQLPCESTKITDQGELVITRAETLKYRSREGWCELKLTSRSLPTLSDSPGTQVVSAGTVDWLKVERFQKAGQRGPKYDVTQNAKLIYSGEFALQHGVLKPLDEWGDVIITSSDQVYLITQEAGLYRELIWRDGELRIGPPEAETHEASNGRCELQKESGRYRLSSAHELIRHDDGQRSVNFGAADRGGLPIYNPDLSVPIALSSEKALIWSHQGRLLRSPLSGGLDDLEHLGDAPALNQRRFIEVTLGRYQLAFFSETAARLFNPETGELSSEIKLEYPQETLRAPSGLRSSFSRGARGVELTLKSAERSPKLELHLYADGKRATFEHLSGAYLQLRESGFAVHGPKWSATYQRFGGSTRLMSVEPSGAAATPPRVSSLSHDLIVKRDESSGAQRYYLKWEQVAWAPASFANPIRVFASDADSTGSPRSLLEVGNNWWRVRDYATGRVTRRARGEPFTGWRDAYLSEGGLTVGEDTINIKPTGEVERRPESAPDVGSLSPKTVGPWLISLARSSSPLELKYGERALKFFDGALDVDAALFTASRLDETWLLDRHGVGLFDHKSGTCSWDTHEAHVSDHLRRATPVSPRYVSDDHTPLYAGGEPSAHLAPPPSPGVQQWDLRVPKEHKFITEHTETKHLRLERAGDQIRVTRICDQVFTYPPLALDELIEGGRFFFDDPIELYTTPAEEGGGSRFVIGVRGGSYELVSFRGDQLEIGDIVLKPPKRSELMAGHALPKALDGELSAAHHAQIKEELGEPWLWLMLEDRAFILGDQSAGWFERGR